MKEKPETVLNRNGTRYSAADKFKAVKLYLEERLSGQSQLAGTQDLEKFPRQKEP